MRPPISLHCVFTAEAEAVRIIAAQQSNALTPAHTTFYALLHRSFVA